MKDLNMYNYSQTHHFTDSCTLKIVELRQVVEYDDYTCIGRIIVLI